MTTSTFPTTVPIESTLAPSPNSVPALTDSVRGNRLTPKWPLVMTFIRLPLILLGHFVALASFAIAGQANPWGAAVSMTNFYFPLIADLGCLLLLIWLVRREGIGLSDLIGFQKSRWLRDLFVGLGSFVLLMILFYMTNILTAILVYGPAIFDPAAAQTSNSNFIMPPVWVFWWSTLVLPLTVGFVEELVYRGYVQPRLVALTGKPWLAILIMSLGFGLQHIALPFTDWQTSLSRFLSTFLLGLVFGALYQKQKRLIPLILAHWLIDFIGLGLLPLLFVLAS